MRLDRKKISNGYLLLNQRTADGQQAPAARCFQEKEAGESAGSIGRPRRQEK